MWAALVISCKTILVIGNNLYLAMDAWVGYVQHFQSASVWAVEQLHPAKKPYCLLVFTMEGLLLQGEEGLPNCSFSWKGHFYFMIDVIRVCMWVMCITYCCSQPSVAIVLCVWKMNTIVLLASHIRFMKKDVLLVSVKRNEPVEVVRSLYQLVYA